jgi:signal transduction histidine kinase/ABC-type amino acid transport substrate-binding protein
MNFVIAQEKVVSLATIDYPPYYGLELENYGFITEIIETAFDKKGYDVEIDFMSWSDALEKTKVGEYDGIFTLWYREDREQWYAYSNALPPNEVVFCKAFSEKITYKEYDELKDYKIGIVKDYTYPNDFLDAGLNTVEYADDLLLLDGLFSENVDLVVIDRAQAKYITRENYPAKVDSLECLDNIITTNLQYLGFSKNVSDYQQKILDFNSGLNIIISDGTYDKILKKHDYEEFVIKREEVVSGEIELAQFAKESIKQKAIDVAKQIEIYLKARPEMTVEDLKKDLEFLEIAVQLVGKTGYTAVTDYDTLVPIAHSNPKIVGIELSTLAEKLPGFWSVMAPTKGGHDSEGFYDWKETDGLIKEKYMYIAVVDAKTADGVGLHVAATTYLDEYEGIKKVTPLWAYILGGLLVLVLIGLIIFFIFKKKVTKIEETFKVRTFSIKKKLILGFLVITLLIGIVGGISIYQNTKIQNIAEQEVFMSIAHLNDVWIIMEAQGHQEIAANNFLFLEIGIAGKRADYFYEKERLEKTYQKYYLESCDHVKLWLEKYYENIQIFNIRIEEAFELHKQGADLKAIKLKVLEANKYSEIAHEDYLEKIINHVEEDHILLAKENIVSTISNTRNLVSGIIVIILFLSIFIGLFISRSISKPIEQLTRATLEVAKKNFKTRVDIKTGDELEELGKAFNSTTVVLGKMDNEHKQLEKAKTEFLSITSHELRSPMTPMQAQLQMLIGEYYGKLNEKQKGALDIVARNTKRLDSIIVDFLEISRIEAARLKFRFLKKDLTPYINRLVKEMEGFMPEKKIKFVVNIDKLPVIEVDPDRVMQILRNLMNNAVKFCKPNCTIAVSAKLKGNFIEFSVKDQGIGIKSEDQKRIFEPFFQAEQTMYREHQGTGLGLAIIRGIVESQNGRVWLESEVGKGSTFYFTIPLKPVLKIRPIKLLFSESKNVEKQLKRIFLEVLGPMGEQEFESLERKGQLSKKDLMWYVDFLIKKGILDMEKGKIFKDKVLLIFGEKIVEKTVSEERVGSFFAKKEDKNE